MFHLEIKTSDEIKTQDKLDVWKHWFNGIKHFFTVKTLPPKK